MEGEKFFKPDSISGQEGEKTKKVKVVCARCSDVIGEMEVPKGIFENGKVAGICPRCKKIAEQAGNKM